MLLKSQPLNAETSRKFKTNVKNEFENIRSQHIGKMFDDVCDENRKVEWRVWIDWKWSDLKNAFYCIKNVIQNHVKWHKTLKKLHPWEGFDGLISVIQTHLTHYVLYEEKYGHAEDEYKKQKIAAAKETIDLLDQIKDPHDYFDKYRKKIEAEYPDYKSLVTEYHEGGTSYSGRFVAQGKGWAGMESGENPCEGYFEFLDGKFELVDSPNQNETNRLLSEIKTYTQEIDTAYKLAEVDSDKDFEKLGQLLKENLYSWWD